MRAVEIRPGEFVSRHARNQYLLFTLATFCIFLSCSCSVFFAPVLLDSGFSRAQIGTILSSGAVPVVVCTLLAGPWAERGGPLVVMRVGVASVVAGFFVLQYGADKRTLLGAATAMGMMTAGVGLFMTAAFLYARSLVSRRRLMRYIGIYSAMLQLPLLLSPMLAEHVLVRWGRQDFFCLLSAPVVVGLLLLLLAGLPDGAESSTPSRDQHNSFLQVLRDGLPWNPMRRASPQLSCLAPSMPSVLEH